MERQELWKRLEAWQNSLQNKTTKEQYFKICEQLGEDPDPSRIPPDLEDFPEDIQNAIITFNKLGDRIVADIGYLGKDYTSLPLHIEILQPDSKELFLETLLRLDERLIKDSAEAMKRERDKLKRK